MREPARMPPFLGVFSVGKFLTSTVILLSLVPALACQGRGSERLKILPPGANLLAGEWHVTSTTSTDTCNLGSGVHPIQGYFSIQVNGASFTMGGVCCFNPIWGTGTMDDRAVMFASNRTVVSTSTCSWQIDEVDAGTVDAVGFSGGASLTVSAVGSCGPGFPCQIHGTFTADRCPSTGCGVMCPAIACFG